jgi:hypothetical protein
MYNFHELLPQWSCMWRSCCCKHPKKVSWKGRGWTTARPFSK